MLPKNLTTTPTCAIIQNKEQATGHIFSYKSLVLVIMALKNDNLASVGSIVQSKMYN